MISGLRDRPLRLQLFQASILIALAWLASSLPGAEERDYLDPEGIQGALVIAGGGELSSEIQKRFFDLAGRETAKIIVIPTAADNADEQVASIERRDKLSEPWKKLGAASVRLFHTRSREQANCPEFLLPLREATGVWFEGGQQSRIAQAYLGTDVEKELAALLVRGGVI